MSKHCLPCILSGSPYVVVGVVVYALFTLGWGIRICICKHCLLHTLIGVFACSSTVYFGSEHLHDEALFTLYPIRKSLRGSWSSCLCTVYPWLGYSHL